MKTFSKYMIWIFVAGFMLMTTACEDRLAEESFGNFSPSNFFKNSSDARSALNGVYNALSGFYGGNDAYALYQVPSNQNGPGNAAERVQLDEYTVDAGNQILEEIWQSGYNLIVRANDVIDKVQPIEMDQALKTRFIAEAHFLRGLMYFNLVRTFGDVPLITASESGIVNSIPRAPTAEVYQSIISDLEIAETDLPVESAISQKGRASSGAAQAILGKVYLTMGDFEMAKSYALKVINSNEYELLADYEDLWLLENENSKEHIFSAQYNEGGITTGLANFLAPAGAGLTGNAFSSFPVEEPFLNNYPDNDYRKEVSFLLGFDTPAVFKFIDRTGNFNSNSLNWPIIRYADVLLMAAEAENELNGPSNAYQYINAVRERARNGDGQGSPAVEPADLAGLNKEEFRQAIYRERELELAGEMQAWYDLVRTGRLVAVEGNKGAQQKHNLMPIPQRELDVNDALTQNEGY